MLREVEDTKPALSDADLDAAERRLEITLPSEYRAWLLRYNGGHPVPDGFRFKHERGPYTESDVAWFFAIYPEGRGGYENFDAKYKNTRVLYQRLAGDLVAIARDSCGNLICLSFGGPDKGKVYFWDHEEETVPASYANCHLIADSLQEFIDGLSD